MNKIKYQIHNVEPNGVVHVTLTLPNGETITKRTHDFPTQAARVTEEDGSVTNISLEELIETHLSEWYAAYMRGKEIEQQIKTEDISQLVGKQMEVTIKE